MIKRYNGFMTKKLIMEATNRIIKIVYSIVNGTLSLVTIICFRNRRIKNNSFIGVIAGISEYDYLVHTWQEATRENESNWRTDDSILSGLLQKAL